MPRRELLFDRHADTALTVVSLSSDTPAQPERREGARQLSILRGAILRTSLGEELCLVRNISAGGAMLHVYSALQIGDRARIEFKSSASVSGKVVWRLDDLAGIQFAQPIDIADILSDASGTLSAAQRSRAPRIQVQAPARLRCGSHYQSVQLCNISQAGARITLSKPDALEKDVVLNIAGLPTLSGTVQWSSGDDAGICFNTLLSFAEVARWIAAVHEQSV